MIKVYQIKKEEVENIYPESSFNYGMGDFDPIANIDKYHHVADVSTDNQETAFAIMNRWNEIDQKMVRRYEPLHSLSVGDILVDDDETVSIVSNFGFDKLDVTL